MALLEWRMAIFVDRAAHTCSCSIVGCEIEETSPPLVMVVVLVVVLRGKWY